MKHLPPQFLVPVPLPTPFRPGGPRPLDPLGLHVRDTTDPHKVRDRLVDIGVLRKNGDGTYSPYLPTKADLVNGKVPASQLPEDQQGVTEVLVDGVSVVSSGTASVNLTGKVDKEQGKGLSSNDYTAGEKQKLTGIEAGAQKNVAPVAPSTDPADRGKPADAYHTGTALSGKQATISDLAAIRSGAARGATAYQKPATGIPATDLAASVQTSLGRADTALQAAPVQSVNAKTGTVVLTGADIAATTSAPSGVTTLAGQLDYAQVTAESAAQTAQTAQTTANNVGAAVTELAANLRYALPSTYIDPDPVTGKYALNDREANWIKDDATSVTVVFPAPIPGRLRDFEVYIESQYSIGPGNMTLNCEGHDSSDVLVLGNGGGAVPDIPLGDETVLYFSEFRAGYFLLKGEKFVAITEGN